MQMLAQSTDQMFGIPTTIVTIIRSGREALLSSTRAGTGRRGEQSPRARQLGLSRAPRLSRSLVNLHRPAIAGSTSTPRRPKAFGTCVLAKRSSRGAHKLDAEVWHHKTTIKDIAKKAGFSYGVVYLYVKEKEDVLLLVLQQVIHAYAEEIPKAMGGITDPLERLVRAIESYCRVVDKHRAPTVLAYRSTKSLTPDRREIIQKLETETNNFITEAIGVCMRAGLIRKVNIDVLTYQIVHVAHGWALKSWYFKSRIGLEEYIAASLYIVMAGVLTTLGKRQFEKLAKSCRQLAIPNT
jgi:AcrR family transcriptional regulator